MRVGKEKLSKPLNVKHSDFSNARRLGVEPEVASKIQARARERGVSVDIYLRDLTEQKTAGLEGRNKLTAKETGRLLREWAAGRSVNMPLLSDEAISRESA